MDPLAPKYPFYTPYQYAGNKPINNLDLDGMEDVPAPATGGSGGQKATYTGGSPPEKAKEGETWQPPGEGAFISTYLNGDWIVNGALTVPEVKIELEKKDNISGPRIGLRSNQFVAANDMGVKNFNGVFLTKQYTAEQQQNQQKAEFEQRHNENKTYLSPDFRTQDEKAQGQIGLRTLQFQIAQEKHSAWVGGQPSHSVNEAILAGNEIGGAITGAIGITRAGFQLYNTWKLTRANYVNLASPARTTHIIAGDATGGGHAWFGSTKSFMNGLTGRKSMFPMSWSNKKIMNAVSEVVTNNPWVQQTGRAGQMFTRSGQPVRFVTEGVYDGVKIRVINTHYEIITAFTIR